MAGELRSKRFDGYLSGLGWLIVAILLGLLAIAAYGLEGSSAPPMTTVSVGCMTGMAAFVLGGLLGLVFGIPRSLQGSQVTDIAIQENGSRSSFAKANTNYQSNTNLEQISDWLTKILVGVGLTQLPAIGEAAGRLIAHIGDGMERPQVAESSLVGFLSISRLSAFLVATF
jgi:hypothetical protein